MLYRLIFYSSLFVFITGAFIVAALVSNGIFLRIIDGVNSLADKIEKSEIIKVDLSRKSLLVKRIFDLVFSSFILILLSPLLLLIIIAIKLDSKGPAIFKTVRCGKDGKRFYAYKFRTLKIIEELSERNYLKGPEDPRITRVGLFLRKTALDELPNLLNVLMGNMSIVGTSIAREFEYENIPDNSKKLISNFKPGLTSLWVVSKDRNQYSYNRRLLFDMYYISNYSLNLDLSILFKTVILSFGEIASS